MGGFTEDLVEVKFQSSIYKCQLEGLRLLKQDVSISREQSHGQDSVNLAVSHPASSENTQRVTASAQLEKRMPDHNARPSSAAKLEPKTQGKRAPAAKPQRESKPAVLASFATEAVTSATEIPIDSKRYDGVVTWSRGSMAWIRCKELMARFPGYDVFLHKNNCDVMPKQKEQVYFRLALDPNGNPKALQATIRSEIRR